MKENLPFQELIINISTKFTGLFGEEFENAIQDSLAEIGQYFNVDAVRLYRLSLKGEVIWGIEMRMPCLWAIQNIICRL